MASNNIQNGAPPDRLKLGAKGYATAIVSNNPKFIPPRQEWAASTFLAVNQPINWDPLQIVNGVQTKRYIPLAKHPIVKNALDTLLSHAFGTQFRFRTANNYKLYPGFQDIDKLIIKNIEKMLKEMRYEGFEHVLRSSLRNAMIFGYSISEVNYAPTADNLINILSIKPKPPFNFSFYIDAFDNLESLFYYPFGWYLDPRKFLIGTWPLLEFGNFFGTSELQSVMTDVMLLERLEKARADGVTRLLVKPIIHEYQGNNRSNKESWQIMDMVDNIQSGQALHFQVDYVGENASKMVWDTLTVLDPRSDPAALVHTTEIINQMEKRITRTIGVTDDIGQTSSPTGSYARASIHYDSFRSKVHFIQKWICELVNQQLIKPWLEINYPNLPMGYESPYYWADAVNADEALTRMDAVVKGISVGLLRPDEPEIREVVGFGPLSGDLAKLRFPLLPNKVAQTTTLQGGSDNGNATS